MLAGPAQDRPSAEDALLAWLAMPSMESAELLGPTRVWLAGEWTADATRLLLPLLAPLLLAGPLLESAELAADESPSSDEDAEDAELASSLELVLGRSFMSSTDEGRTNGRTAGERERSRSSRSSRHPRAPTR